MEQVKLDFDPPAALITLNRPQVRNALSADLVSEFSAALDSTLHRDDVAAVIVTGEGQAFCSGADLKLLREMTVQSVEESRQDSFRLMDFYRLIYEFPKPVIAAVNGPALGGGCGLASVCDIVLSVEDADYGYTEAKIGFIPALVSVFLLRICGEKKARELLLTGRIFSAAEAKQVGLVNEIVKSGRLLQEARELVRAIAKNSPTAVTLTKELMRDLYGLSLDQALETALQFNTLVRTTDDFKEGLNSFLGKKTPKWKGR